MKSETRVVRDLQGIVPFLSIRDDWKNTVVTGLAVDSRKVQAGNCFIAYPGHGSDGRNFLRAAFSAGASSALVDAEGFAVDPSIERPVIPVDALRSRLGLIAANFYGDPSSQLKLLAITGTNGKTSVSQLVAQALDYLGKRCGVIGTLGNGLVGKLELTTNTTPDVVECNRLLADMLVQGAEVVTMEASSHGLIQGRIDGLHVHTALVTNISRDHLDYHGTMEAYAEAKALLACHVGLKNLVLNLDDERVAAMRSVAAPDTRIWSFSLDDSKAATVKATNVVYGKQGVDIYVEHEGQSAVVRSNLIGEFNSSNLLASLTLMLSAGVELRLAADALSHCKPVIGRMQRISFEADQPMVIVDFAHTPDALEKALIALRKHTQGRIWCVFGCGGDRDAGKRPLMAAVAAELADKVILTADNPRSEKLSTILSDMVNGLPPQVAFQIVDDRADAVAEAILNAAVGDVVLVAGKGHEDYQEIQGVKYAYSDVQQCRLALHRRSDVCRKGES